MLEKALTGGRRYGVTLGVLGLLMASGAACYALQLRDGLTITGLSRDVTWGLYIAQFTFLVGVAASAVMVVLPYYLHDFRAFGKITLLGEILAIAAVSMSLLFIMADMGRPDRALNVLLHPTPHSVMFWDMLVLSGYLGLNAVIARTTLESERRSVPPPSWMKPLVLLSIPWAVGIHTVTAFLYSGLAARPFWMTAILAPRFLASAFASGPALLILICLVLKRVSRFDAGKEAVERLAVIASYAMATNIFFTAVELFTAAYSAIPEHREAFQYLFIGLDGRSRLVPWMWGAELLALTALVLLIRPATRRRETTLAVACVAVFASIWIEKGLGMVVTAFVPSPLGKLTEYAPTLPEAGIAIGIYAFGAAVVTVLARVALSVRGQLAS